MVFFEINETDIIRLILKYLQEKQFYKAFTSLEKESNVNLDNYPQELAYLRSLIIEGYFDDIERFLSIFKESIPQDYKEIMYQIKKQQFMELILEETEADQLIQILKEIEEYTNKENYKKLFQFLRLKNVHSHPFYQNWSVEKSRLQCFDIICPILENVCFQQSHKINTFENTLQQAFERLVYLESQNYNNQLQRNYPINLLKEKNKNFFLKYDVKQKYSVRILDESQINSTNNNLHSRQSQSMQYQDQQNKSQIYDKSQMNYNPINNHSIAFHNLQQQQQTKIQQQMQQSQKFQEPMQSDQQFLNIKSTKNEQQFEQPLNYDVKHLSGNKESYHMQQSENDYQQKTSQIQQSQMQQMQQSLIFNMSQVQNSKQFDSQNKNQSFKNSDNKNNDSQEDEEVIPLSAKSSKKKLAFHNRWFSFDNGLKNRNQLNTQSQILNQNYSNYNEKNSNSNLNDNRLNKSGINTYSNNYDNNFDNNGQMDYQNLLQYNQFSQQQDQNELSIQNLHNKVNRRIKNKSAVYNNEYRKLDLNNISEKSSTSSQDKDNQPTTMRKDTSNSKPNLNDVSVQKIENNNNNISQFQSFNPQQADISNKSQIKNNSSQMQPQSKIMNFINTNTQELENNSNQNNFESLQPNISTPNQLQQHKYIEQEQGNGFFDHNFSDIVEIAKINDTHPIRTSAFSSDGENFVLGTNSKSLKIYSLSQLVQPEYIEQYLNSKQPQENEVELLYEKKNHHPGSIYTVDWSRSGKLIATGSNDKSIKILTIDDGQVENICGKIDQGMELTECQLNGHNGIVRTLQINEQENYIYSAGTIDKHIKIWDIHTQQVVQTLEGHTDSIYSIQLGGEGKYLASVGLDRKIMLWDTNYNKCIMQLDASMFPEMNSISLSESMNNYFLNSIIKNSSSGGNQNLQQQKNKIVAAHKDGTISYWDIQMQKLIKNIKIHDNDCRSVEFDPTTNYIATASFDHTIGIYDINKSKLEIQIKSHTDRVVQARFHPYYPFILTTSADCTSRIFAPRSFLQSFQYQSNNSKLQEQQLIDCTTSQYY